MKRTHVAVPEQTATQIVEIRNYLRTETGINETNGSIVAKAVNEYHKNIPQKNILKK